MAHKDPRPLVSAMVLAAGLSRRMGSENKLLKHWDGLPLIQRVLDQLPYEDMDQVVMVSGYDAPEIASVSKNYQIEIVHNPNYQEGMSTSIATGAKALRSRAPSGILICLGDMPFLQKADYQSIINAFHDHDVSVVIPTWQSKPGHPVLFSQKHLKGLMALDTGDSGAKKLILNEDPAKILRLEMDSDHCLRDMDTPDDFTPNM
ncbi:MAG: nucleotidyltransferase family protein [Saprospiraceae bacterium]|nr:nucleotidyltransferase family protein [Saprospiraceae bacterium]